MFSNLSPRQRSLISSVAGLLGYGGWAYYANHLHGVFIGIKAAIVQGSYSFLLTFTLTMLMEKIFLLFEASTKRFVITFMGTCFFFYFTSWLINYLAQTPEILMTILPGYIIGTITTFLYVLFLSKSYAMSKCV